MKKLLKNKILVLGISVAILSAVYFVAQKAIDSYVFDSNGDVVSDEGSTSNGAGQFTEEEMDLEVEGEEKETGEVAEDGVVNEENTSGSAGADGSDNKEVTDSAESEKIYVYITGEVNVPGVVILNEGSRIADAINAAGGTTAKANISKVNLVYVLEDGMKVNIPNNNDLKNNTDFEYITMSSGDGASDTNSGVAGSTGSSSSSGKGSSTESEGSGKSKKYYIVNINTATQTELESLPGIGPSLALRIINYRKQNGKFSSIDEIKNVSGIGESRFEDLKSYITI